MGEIGVEINLICWLLSSLLVWVMEESRCHHLSLNKDASACVVVLGTCRLVPGHAGGFSHLGFWPLGKWSWVGRGGGHFCEVLNSYLPVLQSWFGKVLLKTDAVYNENHVSVEENCDLVMHMLFLVLLVGRNSYVSGWGDLYVLLFQYLQHET